MPRRRLVRYFGPCFPSACLARKLRTRSMWWAATVNPSSTEIFTRPEIRKKRRDRSANAPLSPPTWSRVECYIKLARAPRARGRLVRVDAQDTTHAFANAGPTPVRMYGVTIPGGIEELFAAQSASFASLDGSPIWPSWPSWRRGGARRGVADFIVFAVAPQCLTRTTVASG